MESAARNMEKIHDELHHNTQFLPAFQFKYDIGNFLVDYIKYAKTLGELIQEKEEVNPICQKLKEFIENVESIKGMLSSLPSNDMKECKDPLKTMNDLFIKAQNYVLTISILCYAMKNISEFPGRLLYYPATLETFLQIKNACQKRTDLLRDLKSATSRQAAAAREKMYSQYENTAVLARNTEQYDRNEKEAQRKLIEQNSFLEELITLTINQLNVKITTLIQEFIKLEKKVRGVFSDNSQKGLEIMSFVEEAIKSLEEACTIIKGKEGYITTEILKVKLHDAIAQIDCADQMSNATKLATSILAEIIHTLATPKYVGEVEQSIKTLKLPKIYEYLMSLDTATSEASIELHTLLFEQLLTLSPNERTTTSPECQLRRVKSCSDLSQDTLSKEEGVLSAFNI